MNNVIGARAPAWLRIVAVLGLLWNLFGVYAYLMSVGVVKGSQGMSAGAMPAWVTGAFALAVFGGTIGSLGLLLLKSWARPVLLVHWLALLAQDLWVFVLRGTPEAQLGLTIAVNLVALLLVWLAFVAARKGWLS